MVMLIYGCVVLITTITFHRRQLTLFDYFQQISFYFWSKLTLLGYRIAQSEGLQTPCGPTTPCIPGGPGGRVWNIKILSEHEHAWARWCSNFSEHEHAWAHRCSNFREHEHAWARDAKISVSMSTREHVGPQNFVSMSTREHAHWAHSRAHEQLMLTCSRAAHAHVLMSSECSRAHESNIYWEKREARQYFYRINSNLRLCHKLGTITF